MESELSNRHCVRSMPEVRPPTFTEASAKPGQPSMHCCGMDDSLKDPQLFLQPGAQEVKFMLGPTPAQRHMMERDRDRDRHSSHPLRAPDGSSETEGEEAPPLHMCNTHSYHHYHHHLHRHSSMEPCPGSQLTYENINGLRGPRRQRLSPSSASQSQSVGSSSSSSTAGETHPHTHPHSLPLSHTHAPSLPPQGYGGGHRRSALLNYENLPSLPPVWEYRALQRDEEEEQDDDEEDDEYEEEEEEDYDDYEYSEGPGTPNGYHQESGGSGGIHRDALQNYVNTEQVRKCLQRTSNIWF